MANKPLMGGMQDTELQNQFKQGSLHRHRHQPSIYVQGNQTDSRPRAQSHGRRHTSRDELLRAAHAVGDKLETQLEVTEDPTVNDYARQLPKQSVNGQQMTGAKSVFKPFATVPSG